MVTKSHAPWWLDLVQDNARVHTAQVVDDWCSEQGFGRDCTFPPCSPDLNLIENLFGIMVERMSSKKLDTLPKLEHAIRETWASITRSDVLNLYSSWLARMSAVIKVEGGNTRF
jgi:transposase